MAFDDLNEKPREFMTAVLKELYEGDYELDARLVTVWNMTKGQWSFTLGGRQTELPASLDQAILAELEDTKYIRLVGASLVLRDYSFCKKAHDEYKVYLQPTTDSDIVSAQPDFSFIANPDLRPIIERDYQEILRCLPAEAYKAATVMCGSVMEALLLDALLADEASAKQSPNAAKDKAGKVTKDLGRWPLSSMIDVALDLHILPTPILGFMSDAVRDHRNLIHPAVEIRKQITPERTLANLARAALDVIIKNLA